MKPYPFQEDAIRKGVQNDLLISYPCGSGKSLIGIEIAQRRKGGRPVLIICAKNARLQWQEFILSQHRGEDVRVFDRLEDIDLPGPRGLEKLWVIVHYEVLLPLLKKPHQNHPITRLTWGTILLDEAHRIKNKDAQRTRAVKRLRADRKIALTATEMESLPTDLWSLLNWLDSTRFRSYMDFRARFVQVEFNEFMNRKEIMGAKNLPELSKLLRTSGLYDHKALSQISNQLPPLTESRVPVPLNGKLRQAYLDVKRSDDILALVAGREVVIPNVLAQITLLRRVLSEGLPGIPSTKQAWVEDYVADNPDESILIFTSFRSTAKSLAASLRVPVVLGGEKMPDLSKRPKVLVGTIKAMGESLDLHWFRTAIFVDSEWSSIDMAQAKSRIHRLSAKEPKHIIYLYHPKTIDALIHRALDEKWETISLVREFVRDLTTTK